MTLAEGSPWIDRYVRDRDGLIVGVVVDVYDDPSTGRATWLAVATGFFGTRIGVVPIRGAWLLGADVTIPHDHDTIESAPSVSISVTVATDDHDALGRHYAARDGGLQC